MYLIMRHTSQECFGTSGKLTVVMVESLLSYDLHGKSFLHMLANKCDYGETQRSVKCTSQLEGFFALRTDRLMVCCPSPCLCLQSCVWFARLENPVVLCALRALC